MIQIDKSNNGIATLRLNRADKHNAFDDEIIAQMSAAFIDIDNDDSVRLMILAANGKNFCAGADLGWMKRMASYDYQANLDDARGLASMLKSLNSMNKPTIARVQGAAFGGAVGLVSCCDIAVAAESAFFCLSEVKLGIVPATISPYVIAAIGQRAARRYFCSAETFDAQRALSLGLLSEVCAEHVLDQSIEKISKKILANGPAAVTASKQLVRDFANKTIDADLIENTSKRIAEIRVSDEGQEGLAAFLEKRSPTWLNNHKAQPSNDSNNEKSNDV